MKSTQRFDHKTTHTTRIGEIEQRFTRGRSKPVAVERKERALAAAPRPEREQGTAGATPAPVERRPATSGNGAGGRAARTKAIELAFKEEWRRQLEADAEAERQEP